MRGEGGASVGHGLSCILCLCGLWGSPHNPGARWTRFKASALGKGTIYGGLPVSDAVPARLAHVVSPRVFTAASQITGAMSSSYLGTLTSLL